MYKNETAISSGAKEPLSGVRARTHKLLIETALHLLEGGWFPSVSELAKAADVSRATAYRYFPTQSDLMAAVMDAVLVQVQQWQPLSDDDAVLRMQELLAFAYPQMMTHEGALRAAIQVSLSQWAAQRAEPSAAAEHLVRGNRKELVARAVSPLQSSLSEPAYQRLMQALSMVYGSEPIVVLKDIWQLESAEITEVTQWMAKALIRQAQEDAKADSAEK
ncbi:hypothetical protein VST7929_00035 [Vibrio stylophorae]|uniref:HTH tetR-type domain-containing protein n=1 Tax=Vibrio stylophorae TaxID=659351 RepID=A0ABM8ZQ64_9VIBR|nr:TetR/AcrR family transcriptional regulator [Vibrio stylophorae]CAH0532224.1 hypothetical protein VST7929_00035 [Vibrio stylophorae]